MTARVVSWGRHVVFCMCIALLQCCSWTVGHASDESGRLLKKHRAAWTLEMSDILDSTSVNYKIGELSMLVNDRSAQLLWLRVSQLDALHGRGMRSGSAAKGEDVSLAEYARTESFFVPQSGGTISFVRVLHAESRNGTVHDAAPGTGTGINGAVTRADERFLFAEATAGHRTSFILQLVEESSGRVLHILDSLDVVANVAGAVGERFGTNPDDVLHQRTLPTVAHGSFVYLRVLPRRSTESGVGLTCQRLAPTTIPLSALYAPSHRGETASWFDVPTLKHIDSVHSALTINELHTIIAETGCLPWIYTRPVYRSSVADEYDALVAKMRYQKQTEQCLANVNRQRSLYSADADIGVTSVDATSVVSQAGLTVSVRGEDLVIHGGVQSMQDVSLEVLSADGKRVFASHLPSIEAHSQNLVTLPELPMAAYVTTLSSPKGMRVTSAIHIIR